VDDSDVLWVCGADTESWWTLSSLTRRKHPQRRSAATFCSIANSRVGR